MSSSPKSCAPTSIQRACVRVGAVQLRHEAQLQYDSKGQLILSKIGTFKDKVGLSLSIFVNRINIYAVAHALAALRPTPYWPVGIVIEML